MGISPYNVITFYYKAIVEVYFKVAEDCTGMGKVSVDKLVVPRGSDVSISGNVATIVGEGSSTATPINKEGYTTKFIIWNNDKTDETKTYTVKTVMGGETFYAHFEQKINTFPVHFRVGSDSTGLGEGSEPKDIVVPYGSKVTVNGNVITITKDETWTDTATENDTAEFDRSFVIWNNITDDSKTAYSVKTITEETTYYAHFTTKGKPVQVEIKYLSNGAPIQIDGKNLDWVSASYFGNDVSINYKQNFSTEVANKLDAAYKLTKGYISLPAGKSYDQGATVEYKNVDVDTIVIQFEFDKNATYIQRNMVGIGSFPVAEMPEAYGLDATITVTATDPADIGKTAKVRIGDDKGTFYGVGQTGTYDGHSYKVVKGDSGRADDVKVLVDGAINVCSQSNPLQFFYQFV